MYFDIIEERRFDGVNNSYRVKKPRVREKSRLKKGLDETKSLDTSELKQENIL